MALAKRNLGRGGLGVSALGLGCMGMSQSYGPADETESLATIDCAIDLGVTFFDTAEVYGPFKNEELLGRALGSRRKNVIVATKFGWRIEGGKSIGLDSRPEHVRQALEGSLRRLRTEYVDLYYQHRVDPAVPIEDVVGALADLVREGKVRFLGLSEASEKTIRCAHAVHPIAALQSEYSLWERGLEARILPTLRELAIGLVPFSPLGRGFLTGEVKRAEDYPQGDFRRCDPRFQGENFDANVRAAAVVRDVAAANGATPGQVALAWLLAKGEDVVPIPAPSDGATSKRTSARRPCNYRRSTSAGSIVRLRPKRLPAPATTSGSCRSSIAEVSRMRHAEPRRDQRERLP